MKIKTATFADYIAARLATPFAWGSHDCIRFAVGWIEIATGREYLSKLPPWYNERTATLAIRSVGGLKKAFDKEFRRIEPAFAGDGDLTLIERTAWLFSGARLVTVGKTGLVYRSRMEATCAWSY